MITCDDVLTTCGQHPERSVWVSPMVERNASELSERINVLLKLFGESRKLTSGFRDMLSNKSLANSSPYSRHQTGEAADVEDISGGFKSWIVSNPSALEEAGLWCEPFHMTPTWLHVQSVATPGGKRMVP